MKQRELDSQIVLIPVEFYFARTEQNRKNRMLGLSSATCLVRLSSRSVDNVHSFEMFNCLTVVFVFEY